MKLPATKIEAVVAKVASRFSIEGVLYQPERKRLCATDGCTLAIIPVEPEEGDKACIIPAEAFKAARRLKPPVVYHVSIDTSGDDIVVGIKVGDEFVGPKSLFAPLEGQFPDVEHMYDNYVPVLGTEPIFSLDITLLTKLAEAMSDKDYQGQRTISFYMLGRDKPIALSDGDSFGLIVPHRHENSFAIHAVMQPPLVAEEVA